MPPLLTDGKSDWREPVFRQRCAAQTARLPSLEPAMIRGIPLALLALTLGAFAIGTTEFVIVGLIPTIAADLQVSLPSAGLLVSCMRWAWPSARRC
jgi:hypothetical protein